MSHTSPPPTASAHGTPDDHAHAEGAHPHVLPLKVYFGVWGALVVLTGVTIAAAFVPIEALHVPLALGIASIKASLVVLFFMHLLYDEKFNLVLLLSSLGVVLIFLTITMSDPLTRGLVNPISLKPITAEMTTTTLEVAAKLRPPPNTGHHAEGISEEEGTEKANAAKAGQATPIPVGPSTVSKEADNAHPGVDQPIGQNPPR